MPCDMTCVLRRVMAMKGGTGVVISMDTARLQEQILAIGRELVQSGLVAGTWGNLSAWDEEKGGFWITPSGMDYLTLTAADLVLLNLDGAVLEGCRKPSSEHMLHRAIYSGRPDVKAIVHTHSIYATAHAVCRTALPGIVEDLVQSVGGSVEVASYASPGSAALAQAALAALGERSAVLLANHGLVGVGPSLPEALKVCQVVEKSAHIYAVARQLGQPVVLSSEEIRAMRQVYLEHYGQRL